MTSTETLTYATLTDGTKVRNIHTGECAEIERNPDLRAGVHMLRLTSGPDAGDTLDLPTTELIAHWRKIVETSGAR